MSKSYILKDQAQRVNPQFVGITQKYAKIKKQRQEADRRKHSLENSLGYIERTYDCLDTKLKTKKQELRWLKSVRDRHISDIRYKMEQQDLNNQKLEQLRQQSMNARKTSHRNIFNAIQNSRQEKLKTTEEVKKQLSEIKRLKKIREEEMEFFYTIRSKELQQEKSISKSKINKFYRKKNKLLLNSYRQMIKNQQLTSQQSQSQISFMQTKANLIDKKLSKKKQKLKSIEDEIAKLKLETVDSRTIQMHSIDQSRMTRKSSRPFDILLKESFTTEFPNSKTTK